MLIRIPKGWEIPERLATPESAYLNRRQLLAAAGFLGAERLMAQAAKRNPEFTLDRAITPEYAATGYNNYYEFHPSDKERAKDLTGKFVTSPWSIEVSGHVAKPKTYDLDDLKKRMPFEERLYRFRCVETWAMAVPWTGFPIANLVKEVEPTSKAKYIRFVTANRPDQMPGMKMAPYPWPYFEGLRMDEAMNPLAMFVTGLYGKDLPKQNGAPIRVVTPWKYGYKSIKSIVKIEFVEKEPPTFWNRLQSSEYGFYSNVEPAKPHPRWSQAYERLIPNGERVKTLQYNGYEKYVAGLYNGREF
ncbi:MAG: protein-methionine-sulfoxide reductase catalytic subunit MsrP [Bryobacteraceae bacterium]|nr:protein-methionine-sulfoxide reductase catalytic subunit MsrP [Bryobacteraceae bacterium]